MTVDICGDDRFELIEEAKRRLLESTNIEDRSEEVAVLDSILFRFWQMGWLDQLREDKSAGTCHYDPDDAGFTWWDENDDEHYEEYSASYECDSASCDKCGFSMMVGEEGWFDGWDEITEWTEEDGSEHKGYVLKPRFKHCPRCGRKVTE